jgi:hypothetical protein
MKRLIYLVLVVLIATACEKDRFLEDGPDNRPGFGRNNTETGAVHLPFSASYTTNPDGTLFCIFAGTELDFLCETANPAFFVAGGGSVTGNATHVGIIVAERSNWKVTGVVLSESEINIGTADEPAFVPEFVTEYISGEIHSANGDYYRYKGEAIVHVPTSVLTGKMDFDGGTGRYAGVTGSIAISGVADIAAGTSTFTGKGVIIYPR